MKKRLPTLILFFSAAILVLILFLWPKSEPPKDTDGDGFPDTIDKCIEVASHVNNGCPEKKDSRPEYQTDNDKDGYNNIEFNSDRKLDPNDNDPCNPDVKCKYCDLDQDGLNLEEEKRKGTNPLLPDSDGDGLNDNIDKCPNEFGNESEQGCVKIIDCDLFIAGRTISWNPEINSYTEEILLNIFDEDNNKYVVRDKDVFHYMGIYRISEKLPSGINYLIEIRVKPVNEKVVRFKNLKKKTNFT